MGILLCRKMGSPLLERGSFCSVFLGAICEPLEGLRTAQTRPRFGTAWCDCSCLCTRGGRETEGPGLAQAAPSAPGDVDGW